MRDQFRILVVDSDVQHSKLVVRTLEDLGRVVVESDGSQAWGRVESLEPDVVIAEHRPPEMPGLDLLNRAGDRDVHVGRILLTNYGDTQITIDAIDRGRVDAYVSKPCLPHQLRLTVQSVLERTALERQNAQLVASLTAKNHALREAMDSLRTAQKRVLDSERLGAIGRMIAMIVHDFRGPLSVIRSASRELGADDLSAEERADMASQIQEEGERMTRMCAELIDVTRASGKLSPDEVDVDGLVETAAALIAEDAALAGVTVETDMRSGAHMMLDSDRFRRVMLNLGYNAVEAMPEGGLVRFTTERTPEGVFIYVADTGPGIPEEIRSRLFEPFVTYGKERGSGLGLAVVKKVVEDHGGKIEAGKPDAGGTVFRILLPAFLDV